MKISKVSEVTIVLNEEEATALKLLLGKAPHDSWRVKGVTNEQIDIGTDIYDALGKKGA